MLDRDDFRHIFYMFDAEIDSLNEFLEKHKHEQPSNIVPDKYTLSFHLTSVSVHPIVKCWCGIEKDLTCDERLEEL